MSSSLFGAVAPGISAGEAIAKALDHLADVGLIVSWRRGSLGYSGDDRRRARSLERSNQFGGQASPAGPSARSRRRFDEAREVSGS
jgi:hypothetical protein